MQDMFFIIKTLLRPAESHLRRCYLMAPSCYYSIGSVLSSGSKAVTELVRYVRRFGAERSAGGKSGGAARTGGGRKVL